MSASPRQDLADAAVRHFELSGGVARSHAVVGQVNDLVSHNVRQGASVDEDTTKLVDAALLRNETTMCS